MKRLAVWLSPHESQYQTAVQLVADLQNVHLAEHNIEVLIPTMYDDWPQQGLNRSIGDELAIDAPEDAGTVRALIEALGVQCGGWSVPRGTGDAYGEGLLHGRAAAAFDHFVLNFEAGWADFWSLYGRQGVDQFLGGFWKALELAGRDKSILVGFTFVTNTAMLNAVSPDELAAWVEGTHYVAIEAYIPGDPGLDPDRGADRMRAALAAAGHADFPIVCILERGDLPMLAAQESQADFGVQVWTVGAAIQHEWPAAQEPEELMPEIDQAWIDKKPAIVQAAGELVSVADQLLAEANRKSGPRKSVVRRLADLELKQRAERILA